MSFNESGATLLLFQGNALTKEQNVIIVKN